MNNQAKRNETNMVLQIFLELQLIYNLEVNKKIMKGSEIFLKHDLQNHDFFDKVYIEVIEMNVEDNMHDEHMKEIFRYWSFEEIKFY